MSNQLKVKVVNEKVVLPDSYVGLDSTNLLASAKLNASGYTFTEDCILWMPNMKWANGSTMIYLDNVELVNSRGNAVDPSFICIHVKKGQTIKGATTGNGVWFNYYLYGLKY